MGRKKYQSISIKLWLSTTLLILGVMGALISAITWIFSDFYLKQKLDSLQEEAMSIAHELSDFSSWTERYARLQSAQMAAGTQMVLLSTSGDVLLSAGQLTGIGGMNTGEYVYQGNGTGSVNNTPGSVSIPGGTISGWRNWILGAKVTDFFTPDNLLEVLTGKAISIQAVPKKSIASTPSVLISACPIGSSPVQGIVLLGTTAASVQKNIDAFNRIIIYTSMITVALAALVSFVFARQFTRPLALMHKGATRMAEGDFEPIQGVNSKDELGELAEAMNRTGESLRNHMEWLSQEKDLLQGIIESISDAVIMLGTDGALVYANDPAIEMWTAGDKANTKRQEQILGFLRSKMEEFTGTTATFTLGSQILAVALEPLNRSDSIQGYVAVLRDVTSSLRAEKERRDFLASVTHELRTPLHLIQGYLEAIQDGVIPLTESGEYIDLVLDETGRLSRLVQNLQDLEKMETRNVLEFSTIDLKDFMEDIEHRFQRRAAEMGVGLTIDNSFGKVRADRDKLLQVFINLLDNGLRHTPAGKVVHIKMEEKDQGYLIAVQDEGEGIPEEALTRIFERFYRVDKARSRKDGGMGLGLAIVKQIIDSHGGKIWVESRLGEGTTFWVELPKAV